MAGRSEGDSWGHRNLESVREQVKRPLGVIQRLALEGSDQGGRNNRSSSLRIGSSAHLWTVAGELPIRRQERIGGHVSL